METFRVRLNCVDHYQATPTEFDSAVLRLGALENGGSARQRSRAKVPVIRVFGATETGQKVCAHVHGALPYLYVPYPSANSEIQDGEHLESILSHLRGQWYLQGFGCPRGGIMLSSAISFVSEITIVALYIRQLRLSINHALAISYRRNVYDENEYVGHISLIKGVPFYGYHVGYRLFLKIYLLNPLHMTRLADLLRQGAIMKTTIQPFESHMQFILQWMCDFNLYGCAYLECDKVMFRSPVPDALDLGTSAHKWHDHSIASDRIADEAVLPRQSHCSLEVDVHVADILNRQQVKPRSIHEQVFEGVKPLGIEDKLVQSMAGLWRDETKRRKAKMGQLDPGSSPFPPEVLVSVSADMREDHDANWIHEAEYRQKISEIIADEGTTSMLDAATFATDDNPKIQTALDSVEDLFRETTSKEETLLDDQTLDPQIDESRLTISADQGEESDFIYGTQEDETIASPGPEPNQLEAHTRMSVSADESLTNNETTSQDLSAMKSVSSDPFTDDHLAPKQAQPSQRSESLSWPTASQMANVVSTQDSKAIQESEIRSHQDMIPSAQVSSVTSSTKGSSNRACRFSTDYFIQLEAAFGPLGKTMLFDGADLELEHAQPEIIYQEAFYEHEADVPDLAREYGGQEFKLESTSVPHLADFDSSGTSMASRGLKPPVLVDPGAEDSHWNFRRNNCSMRVWQFEAPPPTPAEVANWLQGEENEAEESTLSQIDTATQARLGAKEHKTTSVNHETQYMSVMSVEVHVNTRENRLPNPEFDEIGAIFWSLQSEDEDLHVNGYNEGTHVGILVISEAVRIGQCTTAEVEELSSELDMINRLVDIVRAHDPDILTGFEVHDGSWGYVIERARCQYDYNMCDELSRMKSQSHGRFGREDDRWGFNHTSTIRVTGRHMINIWRAMRGELNLLQYTMENIVQQVCERRIPHYDHIDLTKWYCSGRQRDMGKVIDYYVSRTQLDLEILELNELVPRTSEQARLLGVDFYSVFSRGSQFKVESLMFRIAKPENFILPSPSRKQVGQQNALECLPLVMEPQSAFYTSPLLVLDFQSLYPSVMIAYNYCYSTFLGRVVNWRGHNKMGFADFSRQPRLLELLEQDINIAPNGIMYAKPRVRKSLLAKMLGEILETRVMVKSGMKIDKEDAVLQRLLNNRQLALKLIANVTYGYTSASFSGRMPCSEIADSIVQTGREILEKAIALIHSVGRWQAEVVYGDTDSLFVYLKGRSKESAFAIGNEITQAVTKMNPRPIKLKFEKVYLPCVLLAKKRYVGFKYESLSQERPDFDAKGIETVRRDGTPAEQKIEEKALKILFRTANLSEVKSYFQEQCHKIMLGKVSIQDFCFAKEVKLGTYSEKGPPPPGALISTRRMLEDPRAEPQYGERVPYVVIAGGPGARLIDRCVAPEKLLQNAHNELDCDYYILKNIIPPLERIFNLMGANVRQWYDEMPKVQRIRRVDVVAPIDAKKTLESYLQSSSCIVCRAKLEEEGSMCQQCLDQADRSAYTVAMRLQRGETKAARLEAVCRSCAGLTWGEPVRCDSKDCPVFYSRTRHAAALNGIRGSCGTALQILDDLL